MITLKSIARFCEMRLLSMFYCLKYCVNKRICIKLFKVSLSTYVSVTTLFSATFRVTKWFNYFYKNKYDAGRIENMDENIYIIIEEK